MSNNFIDFIATIENAIAKLRQLVRLEVQSDWHEVLAAEAKENSEQYLTTIRGLESQPISLNDKGYIIFPQGRQVKWLVQKITIPTTLQGYPLSGLTLRLVLTWWAEDAQIFINGKLVQQGDLFDSSARILITNCATPQAEYTIAIRLVSPNHDIGALMRSHLSYERDHNLNHTSKIDPGLVADELTILLKYISQFEPDNLGLLAREINNLNWNNITDADKFGCDLNSLRQTLLPLASNIKQRRFNLLGHAHLDMAWLWTTAETYEVAQRTFKSVLSLQQQFPDLTFGHTTPALYQWIEQNRPALFEAIADAVKLGKWEVLGGMWIEPEVNLVSGESLIRQLLYGQQYIKDKFGDITKVAWLPDSFGFTWQLPQILKQSGIDYFVTGKLHWNDTTKFPWGCFWWESPDGTQLLTVMSPPNITGVMDTNPITMVDYAINWEIQTGLREIFWLPGVGDHGGGPTKDMLEVAAKWSRSPFFPEIQFTTAVEYLEKIKPLPHQQLPVWQDELYLELHRGCYTTHADQKKYNRDCEGLLYEAELFATLANLINQDGFAGAPLLPIMNNTCCNYSCQDWQQQIEIAWKKVLFNQFHDILPGTSIPEVFTEANQEWQEAIEIGETILEGALKAIASSIALPQPPHPEAKPIVVFNSLNWKRSEVVTIAITENNWEVYDLDGFKVRSQLTADNKLIFLAENIPSVGYRLFWLCRGRRQERRDPASDGAFKLWKQVPESAPPKELRECSPRQAEGRRQEGKYILENSFLKVTVNPQKGDLDSIFDKINQREVLKGTGNKLQAFEDKGQYWDGWNIDPNYEQHPLPDTELKSIQWLDFGHIQQRIRVIKTLGKSEFIQDYVLQSNSSILKIINNVDWQESHVVVKAAFNFNLNSDYATYQIPCGAIARPTKGQTEAEKAKWEVSALKWADLTDNNGQYGVSLLNDCKHGYDSQCDRLRLTLLRSSMWPEPNADIGKHQFTYAIYPHQNDWRKAQTVRKSYELNLPLRVTILDKTILDKTILDKIDGKDRDNRLLPMGKFIDLSADNLVLMCFKSAKDNNLILRCYECHGTTANLQLQVQLQGDLNCGMGDLTNLLEKTIKKSDTVNSNRVGYVEIKPWEISTFKLHLRDST